jgi:hypothetical protein
MILRDFQGRYNIYLYSPISTYTVKLRTEGMVKTSYILDHVLEIILVNGNLPENSTLV